MKKSTKIILPALAVLVLGTAATATGTVAWFAANGVVSAKGMEVKCATSSNLIISNTAPTKMASTSGEWGKEATTTNTGVKELIPSSTTKESISTGAPKFYKTDSKVDPVNGHVLAGAVVSEVSESDKGYAKHTFYVSAQSTADMNFSIQKVEINNTLNQYISQSLRMGIYYVDYSGIQESDITKDTETGVVNNSTGGAVKGEIFNLGKSGDSTYLGFDATGTIKSVTSESIALDPTGTMGKKVTPVDLSDNTKSYGLGKILSTKSARPTIGEQDWSQIDLYFWYEGQDSHCTAANALSIQELAITVYFEATTVTA